MEIICPHCGMINYTASPWANSPCGHCGIGFKEEENTPADKQAAKLDITEMTCPHLLYQIIS